MASRPSKVKDRFAFARCQMAITYPDSSSADPQRRARCRKILQNLILGGAGVLLVVAGCAPVHDGPSGISGSTASAYPSKEFVARVVGDTEDVWDALFLAMSNSPYPKPKVVLFSGKARSACGLVSAGVGPVYCPVDRKVYLDTAFLGELSRRIGAPSDFAQAYLIVHEISHHVQNALGTMQQLEPAVSGMEERQRDQLKVRFELQADCYTGVWAHFVQKRKLLEPGDLEQGLPAAQAVGDASTHGSAAQRMWWFKKGLATGDPLQCDTFVISQP
jgi:predicted metalloprotease